GPLHPDVLAGQLQRVRTRYPDEERVPAKPPQAVAQRPVTRRVRHHAGAEVSRAEGRQNADESLPASAISGRAGHAVEQLVQLAPELGERATGPQGRCGGELQIEAV